MKTKLGYSKVFTFFLKIRFYFYKILNSIFLWIPNKFLKRKNKYVFVMQNHGVGDHLTLTSILNDWSKTKKVVVISLRPEIYAGLNVKNIGIKNNFLGKEVISFLGNSNHSNIIGYSNGNLFYKSSQFYAKDKNLFLRELLLWGRKDIQFQVKDIEKKAKVFLDDKEINNFSKKFSGLVGKKYAIISSGEKENSIKLWPNKNLQEIVDKTKNSIRWVQLGTSNTKKLESTIDMRGKTNLREAFFLSSKAKFILCSEGMFTHLSSAFNTPCITIYSGFHYPKISLYKNIIPIIPSPLPKCAYCWKSKCDLFEFPECLKNIKVNNVLKEVNKQILKK